jgi:hypothetical protein
MAAAPIKLRAKDISLTVLLCYVYVCYLLIGECIYLLIGECGVAMSKKLRCIVIPGWGDPCPRCCQPTEIREHPEITEKHLRQPFYFSRWFFCTNPYCKVTMHVAERYKVWNGKREAAEAAERGEVVWGDSWRDVEQGELALVGGGK